MHRSFSKLRPKTNNWTIVRKGSSTFRTYSDLSRLRRECDTMIVQLSESSHPQRASDFVASHLKNKDSQLSPTAPRCLLLHVDQFATMADVITNATGRVDSSGACPHPVLLHLRFCRRPFSRHDQHEAKGERRMNEKPTPLTPLQREVRDIIKLHTTGKEDQER